MNIENTVIFFSFTSEKQNEYKTYTMTDKVKKKHFCFSSLQPTNCDNMKKRKKKNRKQVREKKCAKCLTSIFRHEIHMFIASMSFVEIQFQFLYFNIVRGCRHLHFTGSVEFVTPTLNLIDDC